MQDFEGVIQIIDKLVVLMPENGPFHLRNIIHKSSLSDKEKKQAIDNDAIEITLLNRNLAEYVGNQKFDLKLSERGREAKKAGVILIY